MSHRELKALAYRVFCLARREVWRGGKVTEKRVRANYQTKVHKLNPSWPEGLDKVDWAVGVTWTLSPPVELGGHEIRVCVSSREGEKGFGVRVFIDGDLKYPGGYYEDADWWPFARSFPSWAGRIARLEQEDGGVSGPIDRRDLLIAEADQRLQGPKQVTHAHPQLEEKPDLSPEAVAAVREVEAFVQKTRT